MLSHKRGDESMVGQRRKDGNIMNVEISIKSIRKGSQSFGIDQIEKDWEKKRGKKKKIEKMGKKGQVKK